MGPGGFPYDATVGAFGVVSAGRKWNRPSSAPRRRASPLGGNAKLFLLLYSEDALVLEENAISYGGFLLEISFLMTIGHRSITHPNRPPHYGITQSDMTISSSGNIPPGGIAHPEIYATGRYGKQKVTRNIGNGKTGRPH